MAPLIYKLIFLSIFVSISPLVGLDSTDISQGSDRYRESNRPGNQPIYRGGHWNDHWNDPYHPNRSSERMKQQKKEIIERDEYRPEQERDEEPMKQLLRDPFALPPIPEEKKSQDNEPDPFIKIENQEE